MTKALEMDSAMMKRKEGRVKSNVVTGLEGQASKWSG